MIACRFLFTILITATSINSRKDGCSSSNLSGSAPSPTSFSACLISKIDTVNRISSSAKLVFPRDPLYALSTLTYNLAIQHNASAIVYASSSTDVSEAVKCAAKFKIPVVARSGGHSYASFSSSPNGLIVDVTSLKNFSFATDHVGEVDELVTFGSGLRLGDLAIALQEHERAVPQGSFPYIGVGGHATCGGFGQTSRMWGLFSDHVTEMEIVSANGAILKASKEINPDLFFAMRGAGPSFGIVTSLTVRTHQAPRSVILFEISYHFHNPAAAAATFDHFQSWGLKSAPSQLSIRWSLNINHTKRNSEKVEMIWKLKGSYFGHYARFNRTMKRLTQDFEVKASDESYQRMDWLESLRALGGYHPLSSEGISPGNNNASYYAKSLIVRDSDPLTYSQWMHFTSRLYTLAENLKPSQRLDWFLEIDLIGGRYQGQATGVLGSRTNTSSFGPRDALLLFQMGGYGPTGASLDKGSLMLSTKALSNQVYEALGGGRKELTGFNCYVDAEFSAARAHREYFGEAITGKLQRLKTFWDPNRVFEHPHGF